MTRRENGGILPQDREAEGVSPNIPVIQTQFEVAALWESGYSKVESKFIKTQIWPQSIPCASFEYCRNLTSQLRFSPTKKGATVAMHCRILLARSREAMMDFAETLGVSVCRLCPTGF